ncbi:MAG: TPM domain-containing protein [bacterium]|nr:TPM domain-containing protein [bacterium]
MKKVYFLAILLLPAVVFAYVSPGKPSGFVNDFAGMLSQQEKSALELKLSSFSKTLGAEISVVTIPDLGGDTIENFAVQLFQEWGIGKKGTDNGALLLVARDDRQARIEVGYGLEPVLTDAQSYWILHNVITPAFSEGKFFEGINNGVDKIISAVGGEQIPVEQESRSGSGGDFFWLLLAGPIWLASILGRSKSWWLGGVLGGIGGLVVGLIYGFIYTGVFSIAGLAVVGLIFDYLVSKSYTKSRLSGHYPWWIGGHNHFGGGGFGGFGGGRSGGGGSSHRW